MKTLKITRRLLDTKTGETLVPGDVVERSDERAEEFKKYSEDITAIEVVEDKPKKKKAKKGK